MSFDKINWLKQNNKNCIASKIATNDEKYAYHVSGLLLKQETVGSNPVELLINGAHQAIAEKVRDIQILKKQ